MEKFKDLYISESDDQIEVLNAKLLEVEKLVKQDSLKGMFLLLNELMRASHTLKGSSATMGYEKLAFLAHVMEDIFDSARSEMLILNKKIISILFECVDGLEKSFLSIKEKNVELNLDELSDRVKKITGVSTTGVGKSVRREVKKNIIGLGSSEKIDEMEVGQIVKKIDYIKVPIERLDALMDLVEELVIDRMKLKELSQELIGIKEVYEHIDLLTQSLQHEVMKARLIPVGQVFSRFPRMVRDLASRLNKKIDFKIYGNDLELDRSIVDKLGEPLVHLIRNAIDHGISRKGYIKLEAKREHEYALISVENNNNGIDLNKVREAAISKGIYTKNELEKMDDKKILNLIFHPRLSTNKEVTEISGRGVGLNIVKKFVESFGGRVMVESLEEGVAFTLELPLTLSIINSLIVQIDSYKFAIPFSSIDRSVMVKKGDIKQMGDKYMGVVDGRNIPLVDVGGLFKEYEKIINIKGEGKSENIYQEDLTVVLIRKENELIGVIVDKLIGDQEVTVKPLSPVLKNIKGFSGSTILGDGSIILILDVLNLIREY